MNQLNNAKIILIFGISAVGKTYYKDFLIKQFDLYNLKKVVTREKRKDELTDSCVFVSKNQFIKMKQKEMFFIDTEMNSDFYGYLKTDFNKINQGINCIGDCHYTLIKELKWRLKEKLVTICIQPKDFEYTLSLIKNLRNDYEIRMRNAKVEYEYLESNHKEFDYMFYTDYRKESQEELKKLFIKILET